ncbi:DNA ligase [Halobacteriales archaeon SW_7_71_33]|nr:MAG: DNA ligase [Halobacteriales archaeon SW_7_71_33]
MDYGALVDVYERLAATDADTEKRAILAETLADADGDRLPLFVKLLQGNLFAAHRSDDLGVSSSLTAEAVAKATGVSPDAIEEDWKETGDLGGAAERAVADAPQETLFSESLTVERVHDDLRALADYEGEGSERRRVDAVAGLVADADPVEAKYVVRTALGHLRIGVGEGTVRDALADAFLDGSAAAVDAVERAYQVTNDYTLVAETARDEGREGLDALDVELFRPVGAMLADDSDGLADGVESVADDPTDVLAESKYDGARVQLHRDGDEVRIYTRRLEDVTEQFPDVVRAVREHVDADRALLDGEVVGYDPETREPVPFQTFSRRIRRKYDIPEMVEEIPVVVYLFDCLYLAGETLLDRPLRERVDRLESVLSPSPYDVERAANRRYADGGEAGLRELYEETLAAGHEGLMLKNLDAAYQPGRRVGRMTKVKPVMEPLDLVVTRARYSEGRRSSMLGRLYLACRGPDGEGGDDLREVGRLSTGYTDAELADLTDRLEELVTERDGREVRLAPEVVLEVAYEEIQASPEYDSGYALRFPRFERVREDLAPSDADTVERVEGLYKEQ